MDRRFHTPPHKQSPYSDDSQPSSTSASIPYDRSSRPQHSSPATDTDTLFGNNSSPESWTARKGRDPTQFPFRNTSRLRNRRLLRWCFVLLCFVLALALWREFSTHDIFATLPPEWRSDARVERVLRPVDERAQEHGSPAEWLEKHSRDEDFIGMKNGRYIVGRPGRFSSRPRAAIISLVRNEELDGILQSMRQLELHWNHKYQYPWVFFNEKSFTKEFKAATSNVTSAPTFYEVVPKEHWSTPSWIDQNRYMNSLDYLGTIGVGKGWMLSYRNMCRWNSGFFYKHPALKDYDFYWRVEPDVHFFCDIHYDPFRFMRDNSLIYGFNMNILDDARSFPSLWSTTRDFISAYPELVHPEADLDWLSDPNTGGDYNNCQFFSNFEIGDLNFFRATANERYFGWLDKQGGFYYERFGDAPIHTLSVALFAPKKKTWFFRDIGYQHDIARHCPPNSADRCSCEPTSLDENFYRLVPMESPQQKPADSCIRQWLGGEWLDKKDGWSQEVERAFGGDGYGGYGMDGSN